MATKREEASEISSGKKTWDGRETNWLSREIASRGFFAKARTRWFEEIRTNPLCVRGQVAQPSCS